MWLSSILIKILVTLFFSLAPCRVDLIIKTRRNITAKNIKASLTMFTTGSGHIEHSKSLVLENPT